MRAKFASVHSIILKIYSKMHSSCSDMAEQAKAAESSVVPVLICSLSTVGCRGFFCFRSSAHNHTCIRDVLEGGLQLIGVFCDGNWVSGFASFNPHTPVWLITRGRFHHHHSPLKRTGQFWIVFARCFTTLHVHSRSFPFHKVVKNETEAACRDLSFLHNGSKCENKEIQKY